MSESGEETKSGDIEDHLEQREIDAERSGSPKRRHHRRHRRHYQDHDTRNGAESRGVYRQRGGCYSSAPDEEKRAKLFAELIAERDRLDAKRNPHLYRLIQTEISRVAISPEAESSQEVDLYNDYPITLNVRCFPPCKLQPNFNYAGRIIGPKGAYLKALMRETRAKITVLGQGVMKDKGKESELLESGDPKYMHLTEDMHFSVTVDGPAVEAYDRMSNAIHCLKRQLLSDSRDLLSLPWILKVVENGAAPPKGVHFPRHSSGGDRGFRQRVTPPLYAPKRRHAMPEERRDIRRHREHSGDVRRPKERVQAPRRSRSFVQDNYTGGQSPKIGRSDRSRRRNVQLSPVSDNYRERSISRNSMRHCAKTQRPSERRSVSPSYYNEGKNQGQERENWMEVDESIRAEKKVRYVPYRHYYF